MEAKEEKRNCYLQICRTPGSPRPAIQDRSPGEMNAGNGIERRRISFITESSGYQKTILSDLQGAWEVFRQSVVDSGGFESGDRVLFHSDEAMSWETVRKLAKENPGWGYNRIQGAVGNLGYSLSDTAIGKILKAHGIDPAPERKRQGSWKEFLKTHWEVLASVDFTTIGFWTKKGLVTYYLLFFMDLATRRVHFAGRTVHPDEEWLLQVARNRTDAEVGFLREKRYLLMDRDGKFSAGFRGTLKAVGVNPVRLAPQSPNLNAHIERFMRSLKEECLERMIFFGEKSLQAATVAYMEHFLRERNHQGMGNQLLDPGEEIAKKAGEIVCRERLGGMLRYDYREAA